MYAFASPSLHGLSIVAVFGGGHLNPGVAAGIHISVPKDPKTWEMHLIANGTNAIEEGPDGKSRWGDYIRVRPYSGIGPLWVGTGFVLHGSSNQTSIRPLYFVFGDVVDTASLVQPVSLNQLPTSSSNLANRLPTSTTPIK